MNNHSELANFIWNTADLIRDKFKRGDYEDVILPLTVLRRLDQVLEPTKEDVLEAYEKYGDVLDDPGPKLKKVAGYEFYNTSKFTFEKLLDDPANIGDNLKNYMESFSKNMRDVLNKFNFDTTIDRLEETDLLFQVIERFTEVDLHPDSVPNHQMGTIFEELIRKFNEALDENPGEHFTPRDIVRLMGTLLIEGDKQSLDKNYTVTTVYDPCCGTGGMLTEAQEQIEEINEKVEVELFGQEVNPETYAICKSDLYLKGEGSSAAENIQYGNTFRNDLLPDHQFDYMIANPPYGKDWKSVKEDVKNEAKKGFAGRFGAGTPSTSDGQLLFIQHMLSKMIDSSKGGSKITVITNASPLFTSDPSMSTKNECDIRRWILENDWLEALIRMPKEMFYNTKITTYVWILSNNKSPEREGKVQLIDASGEEFWTFLSDNLGDKRREFTDDQVKKIVDSYKSFAETEISQIHPIDEFGYRKVRIERPLRENYQAVPERVERIKEELAFKNLAKKDGGEEKQEKILKTLHDMPDDLYKSRNKFRMELEKALSSARLDLKKSVKGNIFNALSEKDEDAEICRNKKGEPESDTDLRDYEYVPLDRDVREYFQEEVKPYVEDAWINEDYTDDQDGKLGKVGYEINFNRYFYEYEPPRPLEEIEADIKEVTSEIMDMIEEVTE
ncbi:SAM-dependent DNA methyltransferase [Candidatus Bipolaricaulota bacterium]|nr:SAM-dependent DNA methyltransferase [Candidatus Bipolaricaulota bacterium]